jgi:hypothetical protein
MSMTPKTIVAVAAAMDIFIAAFISRCADSVDGTPLTRAGVPG